MSRLKTNRKVIEATLNKIGDFGYGEIEIHTAVLEPICRLAVKQLWISVNELPDDMVNGNYYLTYYPDGCISKAIFDNGCFYSVEEPWNNVRPTYFMELPAPPLTNH